MKAGLAKNYAILQSRDNLTTCSANFVFKFPNTVVWFLHIVATQVVKVAFKFLLYLTFFPFYEVSLVFAFIIIFWWDKCRLSYQFNSRFQWTGWHFASILWGKSVATVITGKWILNL